MTEIRAAIGRYVAAAVSAAACAAVLVYSEEAAQAVRSGIRMCVGSVIPSLFPMLFLSQYMIKSGGAGEAGRLLQKPAELLFGLPGVCGAAMLTGLVGGYPAGARAAEALAERGEITRREGQRLANIAFCSGPGFTVGMIGAQLYHNKSAGLLILTAQMISCIILGIAGKTADSFRQHRGGLTGRSADSRTRPKSSPEHGADAFVESASDTASAVLAMCSFILVFQVLTAMLRVTGAGDAVAAGFRRLGLRESGEVLLPCLLEVTGGSVLSVRLGLPFTAFVAGFGGLSVHFQNFAVCRKIGLDKATYLLWRMAQGLICSGIVSVALRIPCFAARCVPAAAVDGWEAPVQFSRVSVGFGAAMLVMCLMSVVCLPQKRSVSIHEFVKALR